MIVEVNGAFRKNEGMPKKISMSIDNEMTIAEIVDILKIENIGYAVFYINDRPSTIKCAVQNNDKLTILPLIDGG